VLHGQKQEEFCTPLAFIRYHLWIVQHFLSEEHAPGVKCCEWLQAHMDVLADIIFTNKVQFMRGGITNTHNSHSWARQN
jgi:hypothetical protein